MPGPEIYNKTTKINGLTPWDLRHDSQAGPVQPIVRTKPNKKKSINCAGIGRENMHMANRCHKRGLQGVAYRLRLWLIGCWRHTLYQHQKDETKCHKRVKSFQSKQQNEAAWHVSVWLLSVLVDAGQTRNP
eukprot:399031-Pelagomonas_calceolata.AAC.2